jgi:alginate O-acetyltransferase complex protein AlgI
MRLAISRVISPPRRVPLHRRFLPVTDLSAATRLFPGEPENCRRSRREFLPILAQLGLIVAVAWRYHLEGRAFLILLMTATVALPIHYLLPFRMKKPAFLAASLAGLLLVFGATTAAIVGAMGLALISLARLQVAWTTRALAMVGAATLLGLARAGLIGTPVPDVVWPVLGSIFMFRMILYLYELKHAEGPETLTDALCYFFLLPNFCFMHFPVVDYRTFRRGYFAIEIHEAQRTGLRMMTSGVLHLLAFRLVNHKLLDRPDDVHSLGGLGLFVVCNYLTYLRVSGQFHMACGMLHLFGFSLPRTHHNYLLATGFTDYWRRINIYWKDFMVRVVFNPTVFRLKRWGQAASLAAATVVVFVATWALHGYQSFWILGGWRFSAQDSFFWGILGLLVLVNVQIDARAPRRSRIKCADLTPRSLMVRTGKTLATFATIAILWSLWSSDGVGPWLAMWRRALG